MKAFPCSTKPKVEFLGLDHYKMPKYKTIEDGVESSGMDLRDYIASHAPVYLDDAFESLQSSTKTTLTEKYDLEVFEELARLSYMYADAMLEGRK